MKQRVAVARTLANTPEVMLMDEPFAAVDAQTRLTLQEELVRLWAGNRVTVLFVTHSVDEAVFLGDRVAVLTPGPGRVKGIVERADRARAARLGVDEQRSGLSRDSRPRARAGARDRGLSVRVMLRPIAATVFLALLYLGYTLWLSAAGARKLTEAERPAPGARAHFEVVLDFPPESFHVTRMQAIGRLIEVKGNSVFLMDVERDDAIELARNYWVADLKAWRGL